jgi:prephenate dehydratase
MTKYQVAFQGEPGAYSELAAMEYFGEMTNSLPFETFRDVFAAVENGKAEYGILPIENSLAGSIHQNYDLLLENDLLIKGEYLLRVSH